MHVERIFTLSGLVDEMVAGLRVGLVSLFGGAGSDVLALPPNARFNLKAHIHIDHNRMCQDIVRSLHGRGVREFEVAHGMPMCTGDTTLLQYKCVHKGELLHCSAADGAFTPPEVIKTAWWTSSSLMLEVMQHLSLDCIVVTAAPPCNQSGGCNQSNPLREKCPEFAQNVCVIAATLKASVEATNAINN